jgi:hypothetical protein
MDDLTTLAQSAWSVIELLAGVVWSLGWPGVVIAYILFSVAWNLTMHR